MYVASTLRKHQSRKHAYCGTGVIRHIGLCNAGALVVLQSHGVLTTMQGMANLAAATQKLPSQPGHEQPSNVSPSSAAKAPLTIPLDAAWAGVGDICGTAFTCCALPVVLQHVRCMQEGMCTSAFASLHLCLSVLAHRAMSHGTSSLHSILHPARCCGQSLA